jgi:hypothetical protein
MIKGERNGQHFEHMPFFPRTQTSENTPQRDMMIGLNEMEIQEVDKDLNLQTNVLYFTAPNQDFPALVRKTTIRNLDSTAEVKIELLDGLAKLVPNGLGNYFIDAMGRTMEAWMNVYNVGAAQSTGAEVTQPFFHISQDTADNAQVRLIKDGYFSVAYLESTAGEEDHVTGSRPLVPFIVDPNVVFGQDTSLLYPSSFFSTDRSANDLATGPQGTTSRTPCAFAATSVTIPPGESITLTSVYGYAESLETFVGKYSPIITASDYSTTKRSEAEKVVQDITQRVVTRTSSELFDAYVKQDFLDNVLRGGLPVMLGDANGKHSKPFHVYSRIHGDLERDYNYFQIDTTYFSQGPGNFRDVSQNRRVDSFHSPEVGDFNIRMFLTFVQSDGYNPLTVASTLFRVPADKLEGVLDQLSILDPNNGPGSRDFVKTVLSRPYRPGQFFRDLAISNIKFGISNEEVLSKIVAASVQEFAGMYISSSISN